MNLPHQDRQAWQLRLFGRFSLVSPSGETVRLPDYKTEGLLAILALNRELGVPRQDAANILWPRREPSNLTNLRQAISMLRRALGDSALSVTAKHCRLADGIDCISDYDHPEVRESGGFMPGHEGDWFEQIRLESIEPEGHEPSPVVDHFLQSLQWFAQNDPRGMYAILGATPSMARSLPFSDLAQLLNATSANPPRGWYAFWLGTVRKDLTECIELLRFALQYARKENDLRLASEVCLELGRAYSRTGQLERSMRICNISDEVAASLQTKESRANALRLRGTIQFHWHEPESGHITLLNLERSLDTRLELASAMNLRCFFEASVGWYEIAEETQRQAQTISPEIGHFRIDILSSTTNALLKAARGERADAISTFEALAAGYYANDTSQFGVYAEELAAKLHLLDGNKAAAALKWQSAKRERERSRMLVTPLEKKRVATVR